MWKEFLAKSEIRQHNVALWIKKNVFQFDVAINDPQL
jgi:hypothetical protein